MRKSKLKEEAPRPDEIHPDAADLARRITNLTRCPVTLSEEYIRDFARDVSAEVAEILLTRRSETATHPSLHVISLKAYRELREDGHTPAQALLTLRETQFAVGDLVADKDCGVRHRVTAVEYHFEGCTLGHEAQYDGEAMFDAQYFVRIKRGGEA
jgi:hypothetical protein